MMPPSEADKSKLIETMDALPTDQWLTMMRWNAAKFCLEQSMLLTLITNEAKRRNDKHNQFIHDAAKHKPLADNLKEVMDLVGVKFIVTGSA